MKSPLHHGPITLDVSLLVLLSTYADVVIARA